MKEQNPGFNNNSGFFQSRQWRLALLALLILILALLAVVVVLLVRKNSTTSVEIIDPTAYVDTTAIDAALALTSLGGVSENEVVEQALKSERLETAFTALLYSPEIDDKERAGYLLALAQRYQDGQKSQKAIVAYSMASSIAVLDPDLPDTSRADLLLQAGSGLLAANERERAKIVIDQVMMLATYSPHLQAAYRRTLYEQIYQQYRLLGDDKSARQALDLSSAPPVLQKAPDSPISLPAIGPAPLPTEVQQAEAKRWQAAQVLSSDLAQFGGKAGKDNSLTLHNALIEEDKLKSNYFSTAVDSTAALSGKLSLIQARIDWLSIKYRLARGGYGIRITPEWEADKETIRTELTKAYEQLYTVYADLIIAMPDAAQIQRATNEALRREVLAGTLHRYPNYPEQQRLAQLKESYIQMNQSGVSKELGVDATPLDKQLVFIFKAPGSK